MFLLAVSTHAAVAQAGFSGRSLVKAELYETGPFGTFARFGSDGSYTWEASFGDRGSSRSGEFTVQERRTRSTEFGPHEYGILLLTYDETTSDGISPPNTVYRERDYAYVFANGVLVLYSEERIVEILLDTPETLFQIGHSTDASSTLTEQTSRGPVTYHPGNMRPDALLTDFWSEGVPGPGIGSSLQTSFSSPSVLVRLVYFGGVYRRQDLYEWNARPAAMTMQAVGTGRSRTVRLPDSRDPLIIPLSGLGAPSALGLLVTDVYPGSRWEDLCISAMVWLAEAQ